VAPKPTTAKLNGPYTGSVGQSLIVDPTGSRPAPGATLKNGSIGWGDGDVTNWTGKPALESHVYQKAGTFSVVLTVWDTKGKTATASTTATIAATPPPPDPIPDPAPIPDPTPTPPDPTPPNTGTVWTVLSGFNPQTALNSALPGDTIALENGATFLTAGSFTLPAKLGSGTDADYITIRPISMTSLPAAGVRVNPLVHAVAMPKLVGQSQFPLITQPRAHHYKLIGIEISVDGSAYVPDLVQLGGLGSGAGGYATRSETLATKNFVVDRCFLHPPEISGASLSTASLTRSAGRGIHLTCVNATIINSWIGGFVGYYPGTTISIDSYGIYADAFLDTGLLFNNHIEAMFNNVFLGGADPDTANKAVLTNATPTQATFSTVANLSIGDLVAVYFSAPFTSAGNRPDLHWATVKVSGIAGNVVTYAGFGPSGNLPGNPDSPGEARWKGDLVRNVTMLGNTLNKRAEWFTQGFGPQHKSFVEVKSADTLVMDGNVCVSSGQPGNVIALTPRNQNGAAPWNTCKNVTIKNMRVVGPVGAPLISSLNDDGATSTPGSNILLDNVLVPSITNSYGYIFQLAGGQGVTIQHSTFLNANVPNTGTSNIATCGDAMTNPSLTFKDNIVGGSSYGWSCFVAPGTFGTCWPGFVERKNLIFNTLGADTGWAPNSLVVPDVAGVGFVNYAAGDYRLAATSPGHLQASDGTDIGCNLALLPAWP
jgi:hypothetical protein